jgi:hypothetical protein
MVCRTPTGDVRINGGQQIAIDSGRFGSVHPLDRARFDALRATTDPTSSCDLSGAWTNTTNVTTKWTFTGRGQADTYSAKESGGCNAEGTATLSGRNVTLNWSCAQQYACSTRRAVRAKAR